MERTSASGTKKPAQTLNKCCGGAAAGEIHPAPHTHAPRGSIDRFHYPCRRRRHCRRRRGGRARDRAKPNLFPPRHKSRARNSQPAIQAALASNQAKRARNRRPRPWYTYAVAGPARSAVGPPATNLVTCSRTAGHGLARSIAARGPTPTARARRG